MQKHTLKLALLSLLTLTSANNTQAAATMLTRAGAKLTQIGARMAPVARLASPQVKQVAAKRTYLDTARMKKYFMNNNDALGVGALFAGVSSFLAYKSHSLNKQAQQKGFEFNIYTKNKLIHDSIRVGVASFVTGMIAISAVLSCLV